MRQHGHEDLHILIAAAAPEAQGLAREVGHAIEARRVVEARLRLPGPFLPALLEEPAEAAVGVGPASLSQGLVAVLGPQLTTRQAGAAAIARRLEFLDDRLPVGLHPVAVAIRRRIKPGPQCAVVEILWQRPGKACRLAAGQHVRDGSRAHPDRHGDLVPRQGVIVTVPKNVLDVHHADSLHRALAFRFDTRTGLTGMEETGHLGDPAGRLATPLGRAGSGSDQDRQMLRIRRQVSRNHRQVFQESPSNVVGIAVKCARILHFALVWLERRCIFRLIEEIVQASSHRSCSLR